MKQERQIIFHGNYFIEFYVAQIAKLQKKIEFIFKLVRTVQNVPEKYLKHLSGTDGLYEIRIESGGNIFRIFCCFDKGHLIVLFNAFQKKTQKTPGKELNQAKKLQKEYFKRKEQNDEKRKNKNR